MRKDNGRQSLDTICGALSQIMGIEAPTEANKGNEDLIAYADKIFGGEKADRIFMYNPDAVAQWIYKKYPQMVISTIISSIWTAVTPYVGIYLSALIIEELAGAKNVERLKLLVIITVASLAFISLISALLNKWNEVQNSNLYYKFEKFYT